MQVIVAGAKDSDRWQSFVSQHPMCFNYHRWPWKHVIESVFQWRSFYLMAEKNGVVQGILPLFWHKSRLFGNVLCSVPFFSQAGLVAATEEARDALLTEATGIARELKVDYLEMRHRERSLAGMRSKENKVMLVCGVHADSEQNMQQLVTKMRTNVRRTLKSGLAAEFGGKELLDDFYRMFSLRMRELGTPVYSRKFFETICENFPTETFVCRILHRGTTIGGAFLTGYRNLMEVNWSASDPGVLALRPNMFLFWNLLCFAGQKVFHVRLRQVVGWFGNLQLQTPMGSTTDSTLLELLDAFRRASLATESGKSSIPRCNLALEKDATRPYTVIRAPDREMFAISAKRFLVFRRIILGVRAEG